MKASNVTVIDYGMGNLLSVRRGLERCGACVEITADPDTIMASPRVILPGVGAFGNAMTELSQLQLVEVIQQVAIQGTPLMGICLGMQLLLDESEEFGLTPGLGLIPGQVVPIPSISASGQQLKIPHIGWNSLVHSSEQVGWHATPLQQLCSGDAVYFVHSFMANPTDSSYRLADCLYGGLPISAFIGRDNIFGCQFHPEKSGEVGLKILTEFLSL